MNNKLFRQQASSTLTSPDNINQYIKVTKPSLYLFLFAMLICVVAVGIWVGYGTITDSVSASGVVFPHSGVTGAKVSYDGVVSQLYTKRGNYIYKGENLLRFEHEGTSGYVTAPVSGVVLSHIAENQSFKAFESCVFILPQQEAMQNREIMAYFPYKALKKLAINMEVQVSPIDLSREEHGYMVGKIISIAKYPITKQEAATQFKIEQYATDVFPTETAYEVKIVLQQDSNNPDKILWSTQKSKDTEITIGTFCNLQVITRKRPIYELIFGFLNKK